MLIFVARWRLWCITALLVIAGAAAAPAGAQMVAGTKIPTFGATMGVDLKNDQQPYACQFISSTAPGNVLWPGEQADFTFQLVNHSSALLAGQGRVDLIAYGTRGQAGNIWEPDMFRIAVCGSVPIAYHVAAGGFENFTVRPAVPAKLGAYALVVDLGPAGRRFVTVFVRTFKADARPVQYPQLALDLTNVDVLTRLGACPNRMDFGFVAPSDPGFARWFADRCKELDGFQKAHLPIIVEFGAGSFFGPTQPLGRPRPWLDDQGVMTNKPKFDLAWLPAYDGQFKKLVKMFLKRYGWPRGPIIAVKFMNEPWEGVSISGWGADMLRYREIFTALCQATQEARREYGVDVLTGGCDSSTNTWDKLFSDGSEAFLPDLDFCSIHYQGMMAPSTIKAWVDRKGPRGRVRIWDTESWVANTDDRVAAVMATNLSAGYDRAVGVFGGNISQTSDALVRDAQGRPRRVPVTQTWSVAASIGAAEHFIGQRHFKELLFKNGLPWVMVFDGQPDAAGRPDPEDGTVVVVGDIGEEFGHDNVMFRNARGFREIAQRGQLKELQAQLAALPAHAPMATRTGLEQAIRRDENLSGATMTLQADGTRFSLYDFYGNAVAPENGQIVVPLDGRGFFLRGDGQPGSFAALLQAIRTSRVNGIEPLAKQVRDMLSPVDQPDSYFRLDLTNVLNRPVRGTLTVEVAGLKVDPAVQTVAFGPDETKVIRIGVSGPARPDNTYAMKMLFDAGPDGRSAHTEDLHVNQIARRTIKVDGDLSDWKGVLPQTIRTTVDSGPTLAQQAWLPFEKFPRGAAQGFATGYLAYDNANFYFAVKVADATPDGGTLRFATRDDDQYFYPETCQGPQLPAKPGQPVKMETLTWPQGVRRYSYRKAPVLPCGSAPRFDNVQIAFNVLDPSQKALYPCPPGTMPGYIGYQDTDYEYALNKVADQYGGGTEIWRLAVPGMPHKQFYPREPKSPYDGPVQNGQLVVVQGKTMRIEECAIPWTELPEVKKRLDAGQTIKFTFRVNDDHGNGCMELSRDRSVAKHNQLTFHPDWVEHWSNELEFSFQK